MPDLARMRLINRLLDMERLETETSDELVDQLPGHYLPAGEQPVYGKRRLATARAISEAWACYCPVIPIGLPTPRSPSTSIGESSNSNKGVR